ncbi:hypothetical protein DCAR_0522296 [Daucus carota subsp. sativus]|uniref:Knottin scorpion toxin-like domain-containing protein n=1 Tax=Daucus carota subsp. sativus TaxID=79200 RepID=A0AAF0X6W1_DAUCS|nr:hypothetical protein DCAR_0522296 [Daucus carota subsp. sativus]
MDKFLYFYLILALLTFSGTMSNVDAGTCLITMDPNGCDLAKCRQMCLTKYNGHGMCIAKSGGQSYICNCVYPCESELN